MRMIHGQTHIYLALIILLSSFCIESSAELELRRNSLDRQRHLNITSTPHKLFNYKELSSKGSHRFLSIPEWYYENATLSEFFLGQQNKQYQDQRNNHDDLALVQKIQQQRSLRVPSKSYSPLKSYSTDDGVYAGDNEIPYITAPGYRVYKSSAKNKLNHDVTLFTQLSLNRFHLIPDLIKTWDASISIALYIESLNDLPLLAKQIRRLKTVITPKTVINGRTITVSLLFGVEFLVKVADRNLDHLGNLHHPYDLLYPINSLRNLALLESRTDLVFSLDADFLPSKDAHSILVQSPAVLETLYDFSRPAAIVLAAFEEVSGKRISSLNGLDRHRLHIDCVAGRVVPFHFKVYPAILAKKKDTATLSKWCTGASLTPPKGITSTAVQGHTNFPKWFKTKRIYEEKRSNHFDKEENEYETQDEDLKFKTQEKPLLNSFYEPYFIARRAIVPLFDTSFRGYSFNKRSHSIEMQLRGVRMYVPPEVFVLHRWHGESSSRKEWKVETTVVRQTVNRAYRRFLERVKGKYKEMWRRGKRAKNIESSSANRKRVLVREETE
ncbi:glycosyl-transferase for dystroglycan-domain-containing protein [Obelidium mucronatum]|nr:glycosyl-transferase for dystroglycan-domain-containing protein [Obelidium mucronatum]